MTLPVGFDSRCPACGHEMGASEAFIQFCLRIIPPGKILEIINDAEKKAGLRCPRCKERVEVEVGDRFCWNCLTRFRV